MQFIATNIPEVLKIQPRVFGDSRGFFMETWQSRRFAENGVDHDFVQDNHSLSAKGTLRGLHYQIKQPQGKLVRVISGQVFDVAVDIRKESPWFGQWVGVTLSAENKHSCGCPRDSPMASMSKATRPSLFTNARTFMPQSMSGVLCGTILTWP